MSSGSYTGSQSEQTTLPLKHSSDLGKSLKKMHVVGTRNNTYNIVVQAFYVFATEKKIFVTGLNLDLVIQHAKQGLLMSNLYIFLCLLIVTH